VRISPDPRAVTAPGSARHGGSREHIEVLHNFTRAARVCEAMRANLLALLLVAGCARVQSGTETPPAAPPGNAAGLGPAGLDALIEDLWRQAKVTPAPPADDGAFLRRVSLDLVGRIPSLAEARAFLADPAPDRRARAVDRLLGSHEFAEHWGDVYADLLFGQERKAAKLEKQYDPQSWLVQAFDENRRYDQIARQLITATGDLRGNGAVGFVVARARGGGGPEAVTGAAARLFLGLQIQCAQCHDQPYAKRWKQEDFYGLVAYFARTKPKNEKLTGKVTGELGQMNMMPAADAEMEAGASAAAPRKKQKAMKTFVLVDVRRGEARMHRPHSEEDVLVSPRFLGREVPGLAGETRREVLARAILGSDLFPKAMVSRTWAQLFGKGIVDPWDDLGGEHDAGHPPLLVALARDFAASGYDVKRLLRTIVLSTAYARGSGGGEGGLPVFAQAGVRPLAPEVLFRSLLVATGAEEMGKRRRDPEKVGKRLLQAFREYQFVFGDDEMAEANRFDGSVPQSLLLMNGELTNGGTRADPGGVLAEVLATRRDPGARLDDLFLAAYTRRPTDKERAPLVEYLRSQHDGRAAYEDVFFALLTSTEAITNH
jgi:uncharacterized protein DUF1549/uncharacterized protein DUF1553